jgi:hypothetical protein
VGLGLEVVYVGVVIVGDTHGGNVVSWCWSRLGEDIG